MDQISKYVCIHGHFYQPPRENPWLEEIEVQDSAYPYHDWNERITAECYAPNTASRILDRDSKIIDIVNNYTRISFDFGPSLLSWMSRHDPETYSAILLADKESQALFSGHGSAIAQVYNHMIMPLANSRDKRTQVLWGIRDFEWRFGRKPEGMWLAETAVDLQTLDILAEAGIGFTILAPHQAQQTRRIGAGAWKDVSGGRIDTRQPYVCHLASGRSIHLFFYDGAIANNAAFGGLLKNGEQFAGRMLSAFTKEARTPQLVHIATDGETYGHHFKRADMALAYCIYSIETTREAKLTIYGEYLDQNPPTQEVRIAENTSWSCEHGVQRWQSDCGCNSGGGWKQPWRAPLRDAMNWLRDQLIPVFESEMSRYVGDPWAVRDAYIEVILDRSDENVERFLSRHMKRDLSAEDKRRVLRMLELQRNAMLMFTSCGWFFDEISGIETTQIMGYASRAMQIAQQQLNLQLEAQFQNYLEKAPSNVAEFRNGAIVYELLVKPTRIDLFRVLGHFAVSSFFFEYPETFRIYSYSARKKIYERNELGRLKLAVGLVHVRSDITWTEQEIGFAVLNLGDFQITGGSGDFADANAFNLMRRQITDGFLKNDLPGVIRLMDSHFRTHEYSLGNLFRDEQRKITSTILSSTLEAIETSFRQIYDANYPIMNMMKAMQNPLPKVLSVTVEFILNRNLIELLEKEDADTEELHRLVGETKKWPVELDTASLGIIAENALKRKMRQIRDNPFDSGLWNQIEDMVSLLKTLNLDLNLWEVQNIYFRIGKAFCGDALKKSQDGDATAREWIGHTTMLGNYLGMKVI